VNHPIPHIVIKTSLPINPLFNLLGKMEWPRMTISNPSKNFRWAKALKAGGKWVDHPDDIFDNSCHSTFARPIEKSEDRQDG